MRWFRPETGIQGLFLAWLCGPRAAARPAQGRTRSSRAHSGRNQTSYSNQAVACDREGEDPLDQIIPPMSQLAEQARGFAPAEDFFRLFRFR